MRARPVVVLEVLDETLQFAGSQLDDFPMAEPDRESADVHAPGDDGDEIPRLAARKLLAEEEPPLVIDPLACSPDVVTTTM